MGKTTQDKAVPAPSHWGWYSFDLGKYRPHPNRYVTYSVFPYADLPPLTDAQFSTDFQWLTPLDLDLYEDMQKYRLTTQERLGSDARGQVIAEQATQLGLTLPRGFLRFMTSAKLLDRVPSCTACTFSLPDTIVPYPGRENGYVLSFLWDQQACGIWHLYLTADGQHKVLEAPYDFVELTTEPTQQPATPLQDILRRVRLCGPSFDEFVYRFWLENTIWFALNRGTPLTEAQQQYLAHYAKE